MPIWNLNLFLQYVKLKIVHKGKMKIKTKKIIDLPDWLETKCEKSGIIDNVEERMTFVIELGKENVARNTGGPFAAAVFNLDDSGLVSAGVNVVVDQRTSIAHAEIMALIMAQEKLGTHRLEQGNYELVSSAQPCAMCYGALCWSGIKRLVIGARREDVEKITGFDEGPIPNDWEGELKKIGISVVKDILRERAGEILKQYIESGGRLY